MKITKILLITLILPFFIYGLFTLWNKNKLIDSVRAFGDLTATYLGVPLGAPIFILNNMAPGDPSETKTVVVQNNGSVPRFVAVKIIRTGPTGQADPKIEHILHLVLKENGSTKFDGTLENFIVQSSTSNGFLLSVINPSQSKNYDFIVNLPSEAGNEYQVKSVIADIIFGTVTGDNVVINEVYYKVDGAQGLDSIKDSRDVKGNKKGINNEWVELYNPTGSDISLKNWTLTDASGISTKIHPNKIIKAGGFALLSKDGSTWKYWNENGSVEKIELGSDIGDGLGNTADHIILKNSSGSPIDFAAWGGDTAGWNLNTPLGSSIERITPGFDVNLPSDWQIRTSPTP